MEEKLTTEYEGWSIEYNEYSERWDAKKTFMIDGLEDARFLNALQLNELRKKIKEYESRRLKTKGKRIKCLHMTGNTFDEGEITSVKSEGWSLRVWVTLKPVGGKKYRETMQLKSLIKDTEPNRSLLLTRQALMLEVRGIEDKIEYFKDEDAKLLDSED